MDPNELISQLNNPQLRNKIKQLATSPQGQALMNKIGQADKDALLKKINGLNNSRVSSEILLQQLNNNPDLINQLNQFFQ